MPASSDSILIAAHDVHKTYRLGKVDVPVLRGASLEVRQGEWVAVLGASGSGKSTLLHILAALDRPDSHRTTLTAQPQKSAKSNSNEHVRSDGRVLFRGQDLAAMSSSQRDQYRNLSVGFVFQFYHLLPEMNVLENAALAAMVRYGRFGFMKNRAAVNAGAQKILTAFGLAERLHHKPAELSGGERQRVAIARALMNQPALLLADEPTGNLDTATGSQILDAIALTHNAGQTIVMVTHDQDVARRADRIVRLVGGRVETKGA